MDVLLSAPLNVFISYSHKDEDLREELVVHLANLQHQGKILAWTDRGIEAGTEWDAEIKHRLETASVILLLISPPFMASKYCYDLEMERAVQRHHEGTARVIPIILRPVDWKDSPFSKLQVLPKDAKPVTQWGDRDSAFLNVVEGIRSAVESLQAAQAKPKEETAKEQSLPLTIPTVPVELEEPSGQVPLESSFYIDRPPMEARCYEAILKPGALIRIKAPRQVGKSSLMIRILNEAKQKGYQATWLSLQRVDDSALDHLDGFLRWLCTCVSRNLRLPNQVAEFWEKEATLGSNDKCTYYFEEHLLEKLSVPLALCLDEVDKLFKYEQIARDFLGLLRAWHEEAKVNPLWKNLRLIITHSKEVYIPLNMNQSPFNVGLPIELPPFTEAQVQDLIGRHGLDWTDTEVADLMDLTGGHPYLVRVALYYLARNEISLPQLLEIAPTQEWFYGDHLRHHLETLQSNAKLKEAMQIVVSSNKPERIDEAFKLASMGLVKFQGNDVVPLCGLYRQSAIPNSKFLEAEPLVFTFKSTVLQGC